MKPNSFRKFTDEVDGPLVVTAEQYAPNMEKLPEGVTESSTSPNLTGHISGWLETSRGSVSIVPGQWILRDHATGEAVRTVENDTFRAEYVRVLHCCRPDCDAEAVYQILTTRGSTFAGPDPYSDETHACTAHVGDLLGFQPDAVATHEIFWQVHFIGHQNDCSVHAQPATRAGACNCKQAA